jgi:ATP-binding cassette, subfamily B, bacterial
MRNPYTSLLKTCWHYARQKRKLFVLIYFMFVISNIIIATNPLFYGWFVNELQLQGTDVLKTGWIYAAGFLGLRLLEWTFHGPARVMERKLAFNVAKNFLEELYNKVLLLPVDWHQENHSGATINKVRKAHEGLKNFFQNGFIYLYSFGKFFFSFTAILYFAPLYGGISILIGIVTIFIIVRFDKPYIKSIREVNALEHKVSSNLADSLSNIVTVITLRLERQMTFGFMSKVSDVFPAFKRNVTINEWKWFVAQMLVGLVYAVTTIGYLHQNYVPGETFMIAGLVILLGYVNQFTSVFNDIAHHYTEIVRHHTDVDGVSGILTLSTSSNQRSDASNSLKNWREIEINQLNFCHKQMNICERTAGLNNVHFKIQKGKRIAVIGSSGSGKSTLLSTLRGLRKATTCTISVDSSKEIFLDTISSNVTLFPQDPEIFENTVLYNITLGLPFSEREVFEVCAAAGFTETVSQLPRGLNTIIQEKGINLSGGQKQRLALARGILAARSSEIILLDEPTSSIDPRTESMIYENLFETFKGKTIISALHRLHLLKNFDYIYVMHHGSIVDEGSFDDLMRYSLVFKEMWKHVTTEETDEPAKLRLTNNA